MGRRQQTTPPRDHAVVVVISGQPALSSRVRAALRTGDEVITATPNTDLATLLTPDIRLVVIGDLGGSSRDAELAAKFERYIVDDTAPLPPIITVGIKQVIPQAFYQAPSKISDSEFLKILASALAAKRPPEIALDHQADRLNRIYEYGRRLSTQRDLAAAGKLAANAALDLVGGAQAHVWFVDEASGALWSGSDKEDPDAQLGAAHGIAGFAVRVNQAISVRRAADDARYNPSIDNPNGSKDDQLAAVPVASQHGEVHAVLVVLRGSKSIPFNEEHLEDLKELANTWAPFLHQLAKEIHVKHLIQEQLATPGGQRMFRDEALAAQQFRSATGDVIRVHPGWVKSVFWLIIGGFIGALLFTAIARVHRYARGPAIIRIAGRSEISSTIAGTVAAIRVNTGQRVAAGQLLVQLSDTEQSTAYDAVQAEFERNLILYLQSPNDPGIRQTLSSLVRQRESAKSALDARQIYAPHDGIVREILVGESQRIEPGTIVASISLPNAKSGARVVAFIPGAERPRLQVGQELRLSITGFRNAYLLVNVDRVSTEILGAQEAVRRYLGGRFSESVTLTGPVVVIEGTLSKTSFESDDEVYEIPDGMGGLAEVQLKSESMLTTLIAGES